MLIVEGNDVYPIEIKKSKNPANPDKNFGVLNKLKMNIKPGIVICMVNELLPFNRDTWLCPVKIL